LSKFTVFLFLPPCLILITALYWIASRPPLATILEATRRRGRLLTISLLVCLLIIWAGYRFSVAPALKPGGASLVVLDKVFGKQGRLHDLAMAVAATPLPLSELVAGVVSVREHAMEGHESYLLGTYGDRGWWYYFPVALAVKTPLAFLILVGVGIFFLIRQWSTKRSWQQLAPICCAAGILLVCLPSPITIGVRHILPVYPMLAITAGFGAVGLCSTPGKSRVWTALAILLLAWHLVASVSAHPDYLAYFNELAGREPERILADSDLDWGQDLNRLSDKLKELGVHEVTLSYFGTADVTRHGLPAIRPFVPYQPATGWIAVSMFNLKVHGITKQLAWQKDTSPYAWLERYQPVTKAGKSINLYYVPEGENVGSLEIRQK
jgi:hypothetical protein